MVLSATTALTLTTNAITETNQTNLNQEITLAEAKIRTAAGLRKTKLLYDATIIGNPAGDPHDDANLPTQTQRDFRDAFTSAGYIVGLDTNSGYWLIDWTETGIEESVTIYSFRTIQAPGAISTQTITAINAYFEGLDPKVRSRAVLTNNLDETTFGATASTFYEYTIVADQPDTTDHSVNVRAALVAAGLGYLNANCNCFKVT